MTVARAPGKIVLSGAYVVLEGAPAIVAAVDRFAVADSSLPADRITDEVRAAVDLRFLSRPCGFDASALRADGGARKLGLGSSSAILVATMAAVDGVPEDLAARTSLLQYARAAHRSAQGGGSGIDVAASAIGGILVCSMRPDELDVAPHALPPGTTVTILTSEEAASTPKMLAKVRALAARDPEGHRALFAEATEGAHRAVAARTTEELVRALTSQRDALAELGRRAGAPIVPEALGELGRVAMASGFFLGPAGAGGGDVAILLGPAAPPAALLEAARARALSPLAAAVGAPGVHAVEST